MRQLFYLEPGKVEWREVDDPALEGEGEALVRPLAVALCDLDRGLLKGHTPFEGPFPLGHEFVGEVAEAGEAAGVQPGDRVVASFQISCGECERCRAGVTGSCTAVSPGSMYGLGAVGGDWGGALADLVRVPFARAMLFPIPDGVEPASIASASDNVVDGWRTVGPALAEHPGAPVLVLGSSSIGLYAVQCALALGAERVDYLDTSASRLALAERLGANPVEGPPPRRAGRYPVAVDASSDRDGLACALRSTEPGGTCTSVGIYFGEETPVPLFEMYLSGLTFRTGRPDCCAHLPEVLRLIEEGSLDPSPVTSATVSFDDAEAAVADAPMKLVIER